jgi:hypothetical protein
MIASYIYYIFSTFYPLHYFITAVKTNDIPALTVISIGMILFFVNIYYFTRKNVRNKFMKSLATQSNEPK